MNPVSKADKKRTLFFAVSAFLFAAFASQLVYHAVRTSATVNEPNHILAGHRHWCGDFGINPEHPPLLKLLATAPLNFRTLSEPPWECGSKFTSEFDTFSYGSAFVVENGMACARPCARDVGDVDAERRSSHRTSPHRGYTRGGPALWMQDLPRAGSLRIPSGLDASGGEPGADLTHRLVASGAYELHRRP